MGYTYTRRVRLDDTDRFQIVFYPRVFVWLQWAGEELFEAAGCSYPDLVRQTATQFPIVAADAEYRHQMRWGDTVEIDLTVTLGESSLRMNGLGRCNGTEAFEVSRTQVAVALETNEKAPLPPVVREALEPYVAEE